MCDRLHTPGLVADIDYTGIASYLGDEKARELLSRIELNPDVRDRPLHELGGSAIAAAHAQNLLDKHRAEADKIPTAAASLHAQATP